MNECDRCGGEMRAECGDYHDPDLPGLVLVGLEQPMCTQCDARGVEIPHLDGLHRLLTERIVVKRGRLASSEIRFLRSSMGWTGVEMARHLGVSPEAVSRWENAKDTIGAITDRLVRMVAADRLDVPAPTEVLAELTDDAAPLAMRLRFDGTRWAPEAEIDEVAQLRRDARALAEALRGAVQRLSDDLAPIVARVLAER